MRTDEANITKIVSDMFSGVIYPNKVEMLIRIDDDMVEVFDSLKNNKIINKYNVKIYSGKRLGYINAGEGFSELMRMSVGDIFLLWGDDYNIITQGWDVKLYQYRDKIATIKMFTYSKMKNGLKRFHGDACVCFTKKLYELMGHMPFQCFCDKYFDKIGYNCGIMEDTDIKIVVGTKKDGSVEVNSDRLLAVEQFDQEETQKDIVIDTKRVLQYFKENNIEYHSNPYCDVTFVHYLYNSLFPQVEISGGELGDKKYLVKFINKKNNQNVYQTTIESYQWAKTNIDYFIDWLITVSDEDGNVFFEYNLDLTNKKVLMEIDKNSTKEEILTWLVYIDEFQKRHNCKVVCKTSYFSTIQNSYNKIDIVDITEDVYDMFIYYKINRSNIKWIRN